MFVVFIFLLGAAGPQAESYPFASMEECRKFESTIPAMVAEHNEKAETKVELFVTACHALKKAPQGRTS